VELPRCIANTTHLFREIKWAPLKIRCALLDKEPAKDQITQKGPLRVPFVYIRPGDVLLSRGVAPQVPSALAGLTAVFGMGTGVSPPL